MKFVIEQPFDENCINMDCTDGCEELSRLAERVVGGESLESIMPELEEHMKYWKDCREEFDALVAIIRAEREGDLPFVEEEAPAPSSGVDTGEPDAKPSPMNGSGN